MPISSRWDPMVGVARIQDAPQLMATINLKPSGSGKLEIYAVVMSAIEFIRKIILNQYSFHFDSRHHRCAEFVLDRTRINQTRESKDDITGSDIPKFNTKISNYCQSNYEM